MTKHVRTVIPLILLSSLFFLQLVPAAAQITQVKAVLFYSPGCSHCHEVIYEILPPLQEEYGDQLTVLAIDVTTIDGNDLFSEALNFLGFPDTSRAVPFLIIDDQYLLGSLQIEENLPLLIDSYLAIGGVDWPSIPSLDSLLVSMEATTSPAQATEAETTLSPVVAKASASPRWIQLFRNDLVGNSLSVVVLVLLVVSLSLNLYRLTKQQGKPRPWPNWILPMLLIAGFLVATYLSSIELSGGPAVCGPVGSCNIVQQSPYAYLFGFLPIGMLGMFAYALLGILWLATRKAENERRGLVVILFWFMSLVGILFSAYLTYLEPFVIGATCIWCVSSAVIAGIIFWGATALLVSQLSTELRLPKRSF
ncbi:MAG: vitamin K epoxide reductase family protein [Anaerolineales bacterium]